MNKKTTNVMKIMGASLAVCSAAALIGSAKPSCKSKAEKTMKKTADKVVNFVDTVASMM